MPHISRSNNGQISNSKSSANFMSGDFFPFLNKKLPPQTPETVISSLWMTDQRKIVNKVWTQPEAGRRYKKKISEKINDGTINPLMHERIKQQKRESYQRNIEKYHEYQKKRDPAKIKIWNDLYYKKNSEYVKEKQYNYYHFLGGRDVAKIYREKNPRSGGGRTDVELQYSMNQVRARDKNTCQWGGCTASGENIDVNHLIQQWKYPQYRLNVRYMVCHCREHHAKWHELRAIYRGERNYAPAIRGRIKNE